MQSSTRGTTTAPSPVPGWLCPRVLGSTLQRSVPKAQQGPGWPAAPQPPPPSFCCNISSKGQECFSLSLLNAALPACQLLSTPYSSLRKPQKQRKEQKGACAAEGAAPGKPWAGCWGLVLACGSRGAADERWGVPARTHQVMTMWRFECFTAAGRCPEGRVGLLVCS